MRSEVTKSRNVEGVIPRGGVRTKMPSVITMAVDHRDAIHAADFFEERKAGNEPDKGLVGIKLVFVYEDGDAGIPVPSEPISIDVEEDVDDEGLDDEPLAADAEEIKKKEPVHV